MVLFKSRIFKKLWTMNRMLLKCIKLRLQRNRQGSPQTRSKQRIPEASSQFRSDRSWLMQKMWHKMASSGSRVESSSARRRPSLKTCKVGSALSSRKRNSTPIMKKIIMAKIMPISCIFILTINSSKYRA